MKITSALISAQDLYPLLGGSDIKIIDATYGQPAAPIGIGNAVNFDIDTVADLSAPLAHTIPSAEDFAAHVGRLGISNTDHVVVYDQTGMAFAAARVWWMFRLFGHDKVQVLDGGLPAWGAAGLPLVPKTAPEAAQFTARFRPELFKNYAQMRENIDTQAFQVLDARDPRRFAGDMAEPRPGSGTGHIPHSRNVFFGSLVDPATGRLLPAAQLERAFGTADISQPVACSCGSGVTACVVALALHEIGHQDAAIYGGSWTEWSNTPGAPIATGQE